jgi:arabinose-5-phosphate isomerase
MTGAAKVAPTPFDAVAVARRVLSVEAQALGLLAAGLDDGAFAKAVEVCGRLDGRIVCTGVGKSGHVARKIAATLASTGQPALFIHATEASHGDLGMIGPADAVLALSKSGETRELADVVAYAKRFGITLLAITEAPDSALGRAADILLTLPRAPEAAEAVDAPTTSTTLQMALGDALAVALLEQRGFTPTDFRLFHPGGKLGAALRTVGELMHRADELPLVEPSDPMTKTLLVMTQKRFGCVGVIDEIGALQGVITDGDLRRHMTDLMARRADEVMTQHPLTVAPTMLAGEALKLMNDRRITVLFVVDAAAPVGILHLHDLLRVGVI